MRNFVRTWLREHAGNAAASIVSELATALDNAEEVNNQLYRDTKIAPFAVGLVVSALIFSIWIFFPIAAAVIACVVVIATALIWYVTSKKANAQGSEDRPNHS